MRTKKIQLNINEYKNIKFNNEMIKNTFAYYILKVIFMPMQNDISVIYDAIYIKILL